MLAVKAARRLVLGLALAGATVASAPPTLASQVPAEPGGRLTPLQIHALLEDDPARLKEALEQAFSSLLGNPRTLDLELEVGRRSELIGGRFRRISATFEGGALDKLQLRKARIEALDVSYDLVGLLSGETFMPRAVGDTRLDLEVSEQDINQAITATRRQLGVGNPRFHFHQDRLEFRGRIKLLFMKNNLRLAGALTVRDGSQIHFRPATVQVSGLPLPGMVVRSLSRRFNPVVDMARAPFWETFSPQLSEIGLHPGVLRIRTEALPGDAYLSRWGPGPTAEPDSPGADAADQVIHWGAEPAAL